MQIGLAVGDIKAIHGRAKFEKLALQVCVTDHVMHHLTLIMIELIHFQAEYVLTMENFVRCLPLGKSKNVSRKEIEPNKWRHNCCSCDGFIYFVWGGIRCDSYESIQRLTSYKLKTKKISQDNYHKINNKNIYI